MFTNFSGSSRKPRQVNLSGRKTHAFGSPGTGAGSQAALDRAHQERAQRQRERESLKAAQVLQRVWRGHSSRQSVAGMLRGEWDDLEGSTATDDASHTPEPYTSEDESLNQLHRLLRFSSTRKGDDLQRIRHYGLRQIETAQMLSLSSSGWWTQPYLRLQKIILTALNKLDPLSNSEIDLVGDLINILGFLAQQTPAETAQEPHHFYSTLARIISTIYYVPSGVIDKGKLKVVFGVSLEAAIVPLKNINGYTMNAYEAFGCLVMPLAVLSDESNLLVEGYVRDFFMTNINYKVLAMAMATLFKERGLQSIPELAAVSARLRLLGHFVYFHRRAHNYDIPDHFSENKDFVTVVSVLLSSLPPGIAEAQMSDADQREEPEVTEAKGALNDFLRGQILSLVNQRGIGNLLSGSTETSQTSEDEKVEEARQLANYALAILRFFPQRGDEIRMWLYLGPPSGDSSSRILPAIRYFWEATKRSSVFGTILRDSRAAIEMLRPKAKSTSSGIGASSFFWQAPQQEVDRNARTADEWRVIFVFLELYTFVLKVTDDEEFFSGAKDPFSNEIRFNALPLSEVKDLTTFLKNLGFTLYFNASDITVSEQEESSNLGLSFFNLKAPEPEPERTVTEPSVGGVPGLSLDYIKGLVTGLIRMVYERDSRRRFLPADHWLMTSRFDMQGFNTAVVEEEENRHKIEEEDAADVDEEDDFDDEPQLIGTGRTQHQRRLERLQRQQRKASRRRYLQSVAPRLEILQNLPFFIPFTTRVQIFREFVHLDMTKRRGSADPEAWRFFMMARHDPGVEKHHAKIRREHEFDDAFQQFYPLGSGLKEPIQITFVDQFDAVEAGIDGGGVTKEFLTSVTNQVFTPTDNFEMFVTNDQHLLYPNPSAIEEYKEVAKNEGYSENSATTRTMISELLQRYEFVGRIIGKCLYEGILVDVNFAPFFLRKWALTGGTGSAPKESGYRPTLNDLRDLDEGLYQGLHQLKNYTGDVEDFSLNFTVTDTVVTDPTTNPKKTKAITKELKPDGHNIPVTNQNRLVYISYMARHRLQNQPYLQTSAFLKGLSSMIQPSWLSMFNQSELQTLVGGTSSSIDIDDLRRNTQYGGTYVIGDDGLEHPTVRLFWRVLKTLSDKDKRAVLKFVTSTPRAPLLGFGTLNPKFSIRDAGSDQTRLPSTSTCVNLLKLPMYKDEKILREKLLLSVNSGAGFDLS